MARHAKTLSDIEFDTLIQSLGRVTLPTKRSSNARYNQLTTSAKLNSRNRMILYLLHYGGFRVGEIANMMWSNIVLNDGTIRDIIPLHRSQTKGRIARNVFVGQILSQEIERYVATTSIVTDGPFIPSNQGKFSPNSLSQLCSNLYKRAGISGSSHSGRRSFITNLHNNGTPLKVIQELVGHRKLTTTQDYIDTTDAQLRDAVNSL